MPAATGLSDRKPHHPPLRAVRVHGDKTGWTPLAALKEAAKN
jgi:hypothetical protein